MSLWWWDITKPAVLISYLHILQIHISLFIFPNMQHVIIVIYLPKKQNFFQHRLQSTVTIPPHSICLPLRRRESSFPFMADVGLDPKIVGTQHKRFSGNQENNLIQFYFQICIALYTLIKMNSKCNFTALYKCQYSSYTISYLTALGKSF